MSARTLKRILLVGIPLVAVALTFGFDRITAAGEGTAPDSFSRDAETLGVAMPSAEAEASVTPTASPVPLPVSGPSGVPPAFPSKDASNAANLNHPKLAGPLAELADAATQARERGENIDPSTLAGVPNNLKGLVSARLMRIGSDNRVQVYVEVENLGSDTLGALKAAGVIVEREDSDSLIVQGRVPIDRLDGVASLEGVKSARLPDYGFAQSGSVVTEGDSIIGADDVRSSFGVTGSGVRVGVISDGVGGLAAAQARGDLPPSVNISTCNVIAGSDPTATGAEGTAMLEIVHDIAPGAELWFGHYGMETELDFNAAVDCLASHTDVVVDDVGWYNVGSYDGTSSVSVNTSTELNRTTNPIRTYSTAVGNYATTHYQGSFVDDGSGYHWHRFQATADTTDAMGIGPTWIDPLWLEPDGLVVVFLQWNDTFGASSNNYDLGLLDDYAGEWVAVSADTQDGDDDPVEALAYQNTTGEGGWFDIAVQKASGSVRTLDMFVVPVAAVAPLPNGAFHNFNTLSSSVPNQSDAGGGVISVGAIDAADAGNNTIEPYSSRGPTNDSRTKPDVTGIDGVCVTGSGGFGYGTCQGSGKQFFGTSAAAPHAAGVAALLLQCRPDLKAGEPGDNPSADRTTLRNLILNNAVDLGTSGMDNTFGKGRLDAYAAALAAGCAPTPTPTATRTATPRPTSTSTPTPTPTDTPTPTNTPTITPTPTATPNIDTDGDGVLDHLDNCPLIANPAVANGLDDDADGTVDEAGEQANLDHAARDNGPDVEKTDVTIPGADNAGDACDEDIDNDWMLNTGTSPMGVPGEDVGCGSGATNPLLADTDGDTVLDGAECLLNTDPNNPASKPSGIPPGDSDRDGLPAALDVIFCDIDYDGDTLVGDADQDCDNDGLTDGLEVRGWHTVPGTTDSDGDGCDDDKEVADINGDRIVSILDPYLVAKMVFLVVPTHPIADLNKDGAYTVLDALLAARNSVLLEPQSVCPQG